MSIPAYYTAVGVVGGIEVSLKQVFHSDAMNGHSFAIQGAGKVGSNVLGMIYDNASKIFVADIDAEKLLASKKSSRIAVVSPAVIHRECVDVFVPCALSGALNSQAIPRLQCKIVAGSANNQLANGKENIRKAGMSLYKRGIIVCPGLYRQYRGFHFCRRRIRTRQTGKNAF